MHLSFPKQQPNASSLILWYTHEDPETVTPRNPIPRRRMDTMCPVRMYAIMAKLSAFPGLSPMARNRAESALDELELLVEAERGGNNIFSLEKIAA